MTSEKKSPDAGQKALADKAMAMKSGAPDPARPDPGRTADEGMTPTPRPGIAPSGAFDAEGQRPVLERSRKVR
jgi:hypothetical protein